MMKTNDMLPSHSAEYLFLSWSRKAGKGIGQATPILPKQTCIEILIDRFFDSTFGSLGDFALMETDGTDMFVCSSRT